MCTTKSKYSYYYLQLFDVIDALFKRLYNGQKNVLEMHNNSNNS